MASTIGATPKVYKNVRSYVMHQTKQKRKDGKRPEVS